MNFWMLDSWVWVAAHQVANSSKQCIRNIFLSCCIYRWSSGVSSCKLFFLSFSLFHYRLLLIYICSNWQPIVFLIFFKKGCARLILPFLLLVYSFLGLECIPQIFRDLIWFMIKAPSIDSLTLKWKFGSCQWYISQA